MNDQQENTIPQHRPGAFAHGGAKIRDEATGRSTALPQLMAL